MTKDEVFKLIEDNGLTLHGDIEPFAKMVAKHTLMNIDPSKFISWQEGFEAGVAKEREACAKVCDSFQARDVGMQPAECAGAIRARGQE
ncbi:hypothetical protein UFOVP262_29 [uncultured Caudovirales phage]|uniref:Uncharacterized protein n=1 Tax=uncultured Caudovirales phage TaxID=2100421 RepID=A0A6J5KVM3_9CAUD|nr:hypothetical protein UFOVP90_11 [uncultured Caudovirales phage]CAB4133799.1 hypothetical protein UFOVP262_29 [uncultured Caudovirales phage]